MTRKVVFLDRETIGPGVDLRRPSFGHEWVEYERTQPDEVAVRLAGCEIAIVNKVRLTRDVIAGLTDLRMIAVAATGTDVVDLAACRERGVVVSNIRGYATATVPEHTFALILSLARDLPEYRAQVLDGAWQAAGQFCFFTRPIRDLKGAALGIVGCGSIGRSVAALGLAFGMEVRFLDAFVDTPPPGATMAADLDGLLAASDFISLHCPLTDETRGMFGAAQFAKMKSGAFIVNTARGELIEEQALADAVRSGRIAGAAIDVLASEPPPPDSPVMRMASLPNVILTPHIAWAGVGARQFLADQLIDNVENFASGNPSNVV